MSRAAIRSLTKIQIGNENPRGTVAAATRRIAARSATYRRMREEDTGEEEIDGLLTRTSSPPTRTREWTEVELTVPLDFEQILMAFLSGVTGGVTPVQSELEGTTNEAVTYGATSMTDTRLDEEPNRWVGATITADGKTGVVTENTATVFTVESWEDGTPTTESAYSIAGIDETWTFRPPVAGDPNPDTYTLEFEETAPDGDVSSARAPYAFTTGFELAGGENGIATVDMSMVGRTTHDATATSALAVPAVDRAAMLRWTAAINDTWAAMGTTKILGQIYGFNFQWRDHLRAEDGWYEDGREDLSFTQYEIGHRRAAELTFDAIVDPSAAHLIPAEQANRDTEPQPLRFVRLEILGPPVVAGSSLRKRIRLDGAFYHAADSMTERGGDRNGNNMTRVHLLSAYDPEEAQDVEFEVVNTASEYPGS